MSISTLHEELHKKHAGYILSGGVAQWVARMTSNPPVMSSNPIKVSRCFLGQDT